MVRRGDEKHLVGMDVDPMELVECRLVFDETDLHFAVHHLPRNLGQPAALDADADVRKLLQVVPQRPGQEIDRGRFVGGDPEPARLERAELGHLPQRGVAHRQQPPRALGEQPSGFGQGHFVDVPRKQRRAHFFLEPANALADRRLCAIDALGRAREGAFVDDGKKVFEVEEIHGCSAHHTTP